MKSHRIALSPGDILITQGEFCFQDVLDDFPHAERISIATFNAPKASGSLLKAIRSADAELSLVTNIPNRFDRYFSDKYKNAAKKTIDHYMAWLDPQAFSSLAEIYFSFSNHAKLIMTDNIAYVGSANFSDESKDNWECGIVTTDSDVLAQLQVGYSQLVNASVRYYGKSMIPLIAPLARLRALLMEQLDALDGSLTEAVLDSITDAISRVEDSVTTADRWLYDLGDTTGPVCQHIDMERITRIESLVTDEELTALATFDPDAIFVDDFPADAYGDKLQVYLEGAVSKNESRFNEFQEAAQSVIASLSTELVGLCSELESAFKTISDSFGKIDNTK